jgi:endonuclease YncB( thermonuclease family)
MRLITAISLFVAAATFPAAASEILGKVTHIVDGDTFDMLSGDETIRIRVCGVDSPERGHKGYRDATEELHALIAGRDLRCVRVGEGSVCDGRSNRKSGKRFVAQCFVDGSDIAAEMIAAGATCDWPKFSGGHYQNVGIQNVCITLRR